MEKSSLNDLNEYKGAQLECNEITNGHRHQDESLDKSFKT